MSVIGLNNPNIGPNLRGLQLHILKQNNYRTTIIYYEVVNKYSGCISFKDFPRPFPHFMSISKIHLKNIFSIFKKFEKLQFLKIFIKIDVHSHYILYMYSNVRTQMYCF